MERTAYETIKASGKLPSPTGVALELLRLADLPSTTIDQIADTIKADPALAGRLLKIVNSPFAGQARRVASIPMAATLLGMRTVKALALGFSLIDAGCPPCKHFNHQRFWSESLGRAVAARHVAKRIAVLPADEGFTCGLLSMVGQLALVTAFPQTYDEIIATIGSSESAGVLELERELFEIDHHEMTAMMMEEWRLPETFSQVVLRQDRSPTGKIKVTDPEAALAGVLQLARGVASLLVARNVYRDTLTELTQAAARIGIRPDLFAHVFDSINQEWQDAGTILSLQSRRVPPLAEIYAQAIETRQTHQDDSFASTEPVDIDKPAPRA